MFLAEFWEIVMRLMKHRSILCVHGRSLVFVFGGLSTGIRVTDFFLFV